MGDPLFLNARAIRRARKHGGVVSLDGTDCLRESGRFPSRAMAAVTAIVCVAISCIWGYIFTSPDMPGINPTIDYAWYIPVSPLFNVVWLASTLGLICAFYLVLRAPPSNPARGVAVAAFLAQFLLRVAWAWAAFFLQRTPYGSVLLVEFFVLAAVVAAIFAARVDRRAVLLMAPYIC
jgi:translocator protein